MFFRLSSFFFQRFLLYTLMIQFGFISPVQADDPDNDDLEETEEEVFGPLQLKTQTELCSADYYIKEKGEKDRKEDRERKNIGIGEQISFLLIGKPKGNIKELEWNIKGDGFDQESTDSFKVAQKITLTARKNLTENTNATITVKTSEGQQASVTINIKIPKKITGKKI